MMCDFRGGLPAVFASLSLVFALCSCSPDAGSIGHTLYVAPDGDDSATGDREHPWKTLAKATGMAQPGDTVSLREGTWHERLVAARSGTAEAPVTFAAYPGETAIIDGTGVPIPSSWGGLVESTSLSHLRFHGLHVRNSTFAGVFACSGDDLEVTDCFTSMTQGPGIQAWSDSNLTIDGNDVDHAGLGGEGFQECISVSTAAHFTVSNNTVHDGTMEGIDLKDGCRDGAVFGNLVFNLVRLGIYVDAWDSDESGIDVYDNVVHDCAEGIRVNSENGGTTSDVTVRGNTAHHNSGEGFWVGPGGVTTASHPVTNVTFDGNLAYGNRDGFCIAVTTNGSTTSIMLVNNVAAQNRRGGIQLADYSSGTAVMSGISVVNNTVVANGTDTVTDGGWGAGGIFLSESLATGVLVRNNIVSGNTLFSIGTAAAYPSGALTIDHNLVNDFRSAGGYHETAGGASVTGDAAFLDEPAMDYHLGALSRALDSGSSTGAPGTDFDGNLRPSGAGVDIGAFERP